MDFKEVIDIMHGQEIDSLIIFKQENITYLTGFKPSSSSILVLKEDPVLFTSKLEMDNALNQSKVQVEELKSLNEVKKILKGIVGIENSLPVYTYNKICKGFKTKLTDIVESSRIIKSDYEVKCIESAIEIAERSFTNTEINETENKVAAELEFNMKMEGSIKPAFDTIVASGMRSSLPHSTVTLNKLEFPVVIDWGAVYNNYCSDTTRTIIKNEKEAEIFGIVLEAQKEAIKVIKPGIKASYVDKIARKVIEDYGYVDNFIHSTGHGLGLEVHEKPFISENDKSKLQEGMVITIEPGIYIKDEFGVRIEDVIFIKKKGVRLNKIRR
jgi:Xaa-Pro dipeptidase